MHPINKSIWNSNGMFIVGAWCEMTLILMLVIYAHQFSPPSRKRVLILFFHIPGRNVARHRCTNGWFGRSIFTAASNCRLCASCWTYGSSWTHWISRSIFGTERNRFHSIIGREAYQVHFGATSPLHTQHLLISFFVSTESPNVTSKLTWKASNKMTFLLQERWRRRHRSCSANSKYSSPKRRNSMIKHAKVSGNVTLLPTRMKWMSCFRNFFRTIKYIQFRAINGT